MSTELDDLLQGAVAPDDAGLPDADATWAAGARRRDRTRAVLGGAAVLLLVAAVGLGSVLLDRSPAPMIDEPAPATPSEAVPSPGDEATDAATPEPSPEPTTDTTADEVSAIAAGLGPLDAPWVAATSDGRTLLRHDFSTIELTAEQAVAYPFRLRALPGGAVVWQPDFGDVLAVRPGDTTPFVLASATEDGSPITLTGTGVIDGLAVAILERSDAQSLGDDAGGAVFGRALDGTDRVLSELASTWESSQSTQALLDGWRLDATSSEAVQRWQLVGPDGGIQVLDESVDHSTGFVGATLATAADSDEPRLVILRNQQHPDAAYGRVTLEVQYLDRREDDVRLLEVPELDDWIPKQLQVRGDHAYVTLLPDAPRIARIDLRTGEVTEFDAPGLVAVIPD